MNDNRPNLPALEEVTTRNSDALFAVIICAYFAMYPTVIVWLCLGYRRYLNTPTLFCVGGIIAAGLLPLLHVLLGFFGYTTCSDGIACRGPLRKRFIRWSDITNISTKAALSETIMIIRTANTVTSIVPNRGPNGCSDCAVFASIWQHLRRNGYAEPIWLPDAADSLWDAIPDELPREMHWNQLAKRDTASRPTKTTGIILNEDYLEMILPKGSITIRWSDVTSAFWKRGSLVIQSGSTGKKMVIPCLPKNDELSRLHLAVIRALRTAGVPQAVSIPNDLRSFATVVSRDESAELRTGRSEQKFFKYGFTALLMCIPVSYAVLPRKDMLDFAILATVAAFAWLALAGKLMSADVVRIDASGYTRSCLVWTKRVKWQDVARIEVRYATALLKNARGKTLAEIKLGYGNQEDRAKSDHLIRAKMQQINRDEKPWLARPWTPDKS